MTGIELLGQVRPSAPTAKLLLLTAYADTDVAIRAINDIGLDYYLLKPWDPPEERLYPVIDDLLEDWASGEPRPARPRCGSSGHRWSERSHEVKTFLARNHVPYRWFDIEQDEEGAAARRARPEAHARRPAAGARPGRRDAARPALARPATPWACARRRPSRSTTSASSAAGRPGSRPRCTARPRASRPSSWSARRRAARPGTSASIENYLGFPKGLSGADLTSARSPRSRASGSRWCSPATSSASRPGGRCTPCSSTAR